MGIMALLQETERAIVVSQIAHLNAERQRKIDAGEQNVEDAYVDEQLLLRMVKKMVANWDVVQQAPIRAQQEANVRVLMSALESDPERDTKLKAIGFEYVDGQLIAAAFEN